MVGALFKHGDNFVNQLRHLEHRWNDRVRAEGPFVKPYLDGRLSVVLELEADGGAQEDSLIAIYNKLGPDLRGDELRPIGSEHLDARYPRHVNYGCDELVFVTDVQVVNGSKQLVPSSVRLKRVKQVDDLWSGPVYCSLSNFCLKVFWSFAEGEVNAGNAISVVAHDIASHDVEGRAQVVDCIANDEWPEVWQGVSLDYPQQLIARLGVTVNDHAIGFFPREDQNLPIQVSDVLIGPLNF